MGAPQGRREPGLKRTKNTNSLVFVAVMALLGVALSSGCKGAPSEDPGVRSVQAEAEGAEAPEETPVGAAVAGEVVERQHYYSPYYLTLKGGDYVFRTVTFQDVGMKQPEPGEMAPEVLQTIADSLAKKFSEHEGLSLASEVLYDKALEDPNNHLFCESEHLYVALWRGYSPDRWGYSLWSGCAEEHQFAWEEVLDPVGLDKDVVGSVEYLTASIAESLSQATEAKCFFESC